MHARRLMTAALMLMFCSWPMSEGLARSKKGASKIDPGTVKGEIERIDSDYHKFGAQGWILVRWDVEDPKDIDRRLLVVGGGSKEGDGIDCPITREGQPLSFRDLKVGQEVEADFKMGYDALHCTAVRVMKEASNSPQAETGSRE